MERKREREGRTLHVYSVSFSASCGGELADGARMVVGLIKN